MASGSGVKPLTITGMSILNSHALFATEKRKHKSTITIGCGNAIQASVMQRATNSL
jgi:hypothetical protein